MGQGAGSFLAAPSLLSGGSGAQPLPHHSLVLGMEERPRGQPEELRGSEAGGHQTGRTSRKPGSPQPQPQRLRAGNSIGFLPGLFAPMVVPHPQAKGGQGGLMGPLGGFWAALGSLGVSGGQRVFGMTTIRIWERVFTGGAPTPPQIPRPPSLTCLKKLRVCWAAVRAMMVWLLPGLGCRDSERLETTWAFRSVMLTFSSATVTSVSPSTASTSGDTTCGGRGDRHHPTTQSHGDGRVERRPGGYLEERGARLPPRQREAVHQVGHPWVIHAHEVADQVGHLHQPVGSQHGDHLPRALRRRGVELGEDLQRGVLVLQGTAPALLPLLLVLLVLAVPHRPVGWGQERGGRAGRNEGGCREKASWPKRCLLSVSVSEERANHGLCPLSS